jgi:hypothetical protein
MSTNENEYFTIEKDGTIKITGRTCSFKQEMKKQRIVNAIEEYIECPCGSEMKFVSMIQCAGIWECSSCKLRTVTIYNALNSLTKEIK